MSSLSFGGLMALCWSFTGVAIVLSVGRFILRQKTTAKLQWDDAFHALALVCSVAVMAIYTAAFMLFSKSKFITSGQGPAPPSPVLTRYFHFEIVGSLLWWVCIHSVKFSFLLFYRKIFSVSQAFLKAWWIVVAYTFLTFWACFGGTLATGGSASDLSKPVSTINLQIKIAKYWCVLNVSSDLAIMALPLWMLKGLQMPTSQKIGLGCLFCLAFVGIAFDILRTVYSIEGESVTLDTVWDTLETQFAVIISCLPTYRSLFSTVRKREAKRYKEIEPSIHDKAGRSPPCHSFGQSFHGSPSQQDLAETHSDTLPSVSCAEAHEVV